MAVKASSQVTLVDLTDAYGVVVGSEAHVFMGDTDSVKNTQTTSFMVSAMRGSEQVPCTVGKITCPTGISAVSDGKSPSPTITVTATTALKSGGALDIPVTIDGGIVIHKTFSYSIAFTGATGATGAAGKGIKSAVTTYQAGTSGTTPPSGEWQSTIPSVPAGQFLWTRTVTTYTDDSSPTTAYAVGKMGNTGATGSAGKGVKSTAVTYQKSTSGTTAPTGTWQTSIPSVPEGQYLWTRTIITYTDNSTSNPAYSVSKMGAKGDKGDKGDKGEQGQKGDAGADAITIVISSSGGLIFKNTDIATTLTAHVYRGGAEVTGSALTALGTIKWYKDGSQSAIATGQTLTIDAGDVQSRASYVAQLES